MLNLCSMRPRIAACMVWPNVLKLRIGMLISVCQLHVLHLVQRALIYLGVDATIEPRRAIFQQCTRCHGEESSGRGQQCGHRQRHQPCSHREGSPGNIYTPGCDRAKLGSPPASVQRRLGLTEAILLTQEASALKDVDRVLGAGFTANHLKDSGCTATELKDFGCNLCDLIDAGFTSQQLKHAGFLLLELVRVRSAAKAVCAPSSYQACWNLRASL